MMAGEKPNQYPGYISNLIADIKDIKPIGKALYLKKEADTCVWILMILNLSQIKRADMNKIKFVKHNPRQILP